MRQRRRHLLRRQRTETLCLDSRSRKGLLRERGVRNRRREDLPARSDYVTLKYTIRILLLFLLTQSLHAQERRLRAVRIQEAITLDGVLNERAWQDAPVATDFTQQEPREGMPAT